MSYLMSIKGGGMTNVLIVCESVEATNIEVVRMFGMLQKIFTLLSL